MFYIVIIQDIHEYTIINVSNILNEEEANNFSRGYYHNDYLKTWYTVNIDTGKVAYYK